MYKCEKRFGYHTLELKCRKYQIVKIWPRVPRYDT